jgi:hypothetical protein
MKKATLILMIWIFVMTACAPQQSPTDPTSIIDEQPTRPGDELTSAQTAALTALSETLNLPADEITFVSADGVTWPNGCLGIVRMGVMCTEAEVPGYKMTLEANGETYEVHTNGDGSIALVAEDTQSSSVVEDAVIKQLAQNLDLNEGEVSVVSDVLVEFGDSCLGIVMEEVMCAQVVTPGYIIILEADGVKYEYHVSENGLLIQPATLSLTWKRDGGFAGFCDRLAVYLSGEIYGNQCKTQDSRMGTFASLLSATEQKQFRDWIEKYGQLELDASDPKGVADGMTLVIMLYGNGDTQSVVEDEQKIFLWAQDVYQKLYD